MAPFCHLFNFFWFYETQFFIGALAYVFFYSGSLFLSHLVNPIWINAALSHTVSASASEAKYDLNPEPADAKPTADAAT